MVVMSILIPWLLVQGYGILSKVWLQAVVSKHSVFLKVTNPLCGSIRQDNDK